MPVQISQPSKSFPPLAIAPVNIAIVLLLPVRLPHVLQVVPSRPKPIEAAFPFREVARAIGAMAWELDVWMHPMLLAQMLAKVITAPESALSTVLLAPRARIAFLRLVDLTVACQRVLAREKCSAYGTGERLVLGFPCVVFNLGGSREGGKAYRTYMGGQHALRVCGSALEEIRWPWLWKGV